MAAVVVDSSLWTRCGPERSGTGVNWGTRMLSPFRLNTSCAPRDRTDSKPRPAARAASRIVFSRSRRFTRLRPVTALNQVKLLHSQPPRITRASVAATSASWSGRTWLYQRVKRSGLMSLPSSHVNTRSLRAVPYRSVASSCQAGPAAARFPALPASVAAQHVERLGVQRHPSTSTTSRRNDSWTSGAPFLDGGPDR